MTYIHFTVENSCWVEISLAMGSSAQKLEINLDDQNSLLTMLNISLKQARLPNSETFNGATLNVKDKSKPNGHKEKRHK